MVNCTVRVKSLSAEEDVVARDCGCACCLGTIPPPGPRPGLEFGVADFLHDDDDDDDEDDSDDDAMTGDATTTTGSTTVAVDADAGADADINTDELGRCTGDVVVVDRGELGVGEVGVGEVGMVVVVVMAAGVGELVPAKGMCGGMLSCLRTRMRVCRAMERGE